MTGESWDRPHPDYIWIGHLVDDLTEVSARLTVVHVNHPDRSNVDSREYHWSDGSVTVGRIDTALRLATLFMECAKVSRDIRRQETRFIRDYGMVPASLREALE